MTLAFASTANALHSAAIVRRPERRGHGMRRVPGLLAAALKALCLRGLAALAAKTAAASAARAPDLPGGDRTVTMAARPLSKAEHWDRTVRPLEAAAGHARAMRELQSAAGKQLLSVDYALGQLIDDLSAVMVVPQLPRASAHVVPVEPVRLTEAPAADSIRIAPLAA